MIDNWDGDDDGWRTNIMEGPHGGGRSFSELWAEGDWRWRLSFIATMSAIAGFFALALYGLYWMKQSVGS
jgi:hypothetical protein